MTTPPLDQRSRQVLLAVIAEYVETARARRLARPWRGGTSAACRRRPSATPWPTSRSMGYLTQPHTSAGRVPTDKAYRFYVDHLQRVPWVAGKAPRGGPAVRRAAGRRGRAAHGGGARPALVRHAHDGHAARAAAQAHRAGPDRAGRPGRGPRARGGRDGHGLGHRAADQHRAAGRERGAARDRAGRSTRRYRGKTFQADPRRHDRARRPARSALDPEPRRARPDRRRSCATARST